MVKTIRTHCRRGHELTPENTYVVKSTGARRCRKCYTNTRHRFEARRRARKSRRATALSRNNLIDDLDLALLAALPDEGAKMGKYIADSRTSVQLHKELDDPYMTAQVIGRRLTELADEGFVVAVVFGTQKTTKGWQRTTKGKAAVRAATKSTQEGDAE